MHASGRRTFHDALPGSCWGSQASFAEHCGRWNQTPYCLFIFLIQDKRRVLLVEFYELADLPYSRETKACTSGLRWRWPVLGQRCTPPPTRRRWTLGWRIWSTASAARYVASAWVPEVSKECAGQLFFAIFRQKCTRIYYRLLPRLYLVNRLWPFQCGSRKSHVRTARKGIENSNQDVSRYIITIRLWRHTLSDTFCTHILFAPPLPALQSEPLPTAWTSCTSTVGGFFLFFVVFCRCLTTKPHLSSLNQRSCWSLLSWRKL